MCSLLLVVQAAWAFAQAPGANVTPILRIGVTDHVQSLAGALLASTEHERPPGVAVEHAVMRSMQLLQLVCEAPTGAQPRIVLTTRGMPAALVRRCDALYDDSLVGVELGRDAVVLAMRSDGEPIALATRHVYLALARDMPSEDEFRRNVAIRWSDLDPALPRVDIRFQLPPESDHRRHAFDNMVLEGGCRSVPLVKGIYEASQRVPRCVTLRVDRVREIPPEHAVRSLLEAPPGTIGVVSYSDVLAAGGKLVAVPLDGYVPSEATIRDGSYGFTMSYWLYANRAEQHPPTDERIAGEIRRIVGLASSDAMIGPDGALTRLGLVPLSAQERAAQRERVAARDVPLDLAWALNWVASAITGTWDLIGSAVSDMRAEEHPTSVDLAKLMEIAGYKLAEFESSIGLIPTAGMTFKISREMSEADRDYLERELARDARSRHSIRSALQRRLIRTIVGISDSEGFQVSKVDVDLLPLPAVKFTIVPKGNGGGSDSIMLLRAIERLGDRLPEAVR